MAWFKHLPRQDALNLDTRTPAHALRVRRGWCRWRRLQGVQVRVLAPPADGSDLAYGTVATMLRALQCCRSISASGGDVATSLVNPCRPWSMCVSNTLASCEASCHHKLEGRVRASIHRVQPVKIRSIAVDLKVHLGGTAGRHSTGSGLTECTHSAGSSSYCRTKLCHCRKHEAGFVVTCY